MLYKVRGSKQGLHMDEILMFSAKQHKSQTSPFLITITEEKNADEHLILFIIHQVVNFSYTTLNCAVHNFT